MRRTDTHPLTPFTEYCAHCAHCGRLLRPVHAPTGMPEYCPPHETEAGRVRPDRAQELAAEAPAEQP